jgi:hypothetical protein
MRSESDTRIEERYLSFVGRPSERVMRSIRQTASPDQPALPGEYPPNSEVLLVDFSYADLPLGKTFDLVFPKGRPDNAEACRSQIVAVTQQFSKPFPEVPHGWRTVCLVRFHPSVPELVLGLPVVESWSENSQGVCVCTRDTWEHLLSANAPAV